MDYKKRWSNQKSSGHRQTDNLYYEKKAAEHIHILDSDAKISSLDIGCGAGELLDHLVKDVNVHEAVGYSKDMLNQMIEPSGRFFRAFVQCKHLNFISPKHHPDCSNFGMRTYH